jgi:hypothetical protein
VSYKFEQAAAISKMILRGGPDFERRGKARRKKLARAVHVTHAGRPVAEVDAELRRRFAAHAITPQEPAFSAAVRAIAAGERP